MTKLLAIAGALACLGSFGALTAYTAATTPGHLWILGGFLLGAVVVECLVQLRGRKATHPPMR